jgi:phosphoribosylformimino-5-aminoimidazole carboxamide ribonucleotide (ProFAR) isomerase
MGSNRRPFCETFLYTPIDTEGLMGGTPMKTVRAIRQATGRRLVGAGGIKTQREIDRLGALGMDAVVGTAWYSGTILSGRQPPRLAHGANSLEA